jgi:hypothetical protein
MSYLRGPLTLPQIETLMAGKKETFESPPETKKEFKEKPTAPIGVPAFYLYPKNDPSPTFHARVFGSGKLHFIDAKKKVDTWQQVAMSAVVTDNSNPSWEQGQEITHQLSQLERSPPQNSQFDDLPASLMQAKNYPQFSKGFAEYLYQNHTFDLFEAPDVKMTSKPEENEDDFRARIAASQREKIDEDVKKVRDRYASKIATLKDRIQRAQVKAENQKSQATRQMWDTFLSFVATVLGAVFGRKAWSKGSISQAETSIRKAGRITKDQQTAARAEESVGSLQQQLDDLQAEMEKETAQVMEKADPSKITIEKTSIRPRKSDISIETIGILWSTDGKKA